MSTICYDRSGNEAPGLVACSSSSDSNGTACCLPSDNCATNGLCADPDFADMQTPYFVRGCSDVKWESAACVDNYNAFEGNGVKTCGSSKFCCYDFDGCDCDNSTAVFSLSPVRVATTIPSATGLSTSSSHAAAASTTASSLQTANTNNDDNIKVGLSVGLGVGIPVSCVVVAVVWFFNRRAERRHEVLMQPARVHAHKDAVCVICGGPDIDNLVPSELANTARTPEMP